MYKITDESKERWLFIDSCDDSWDLESPDGFFELLIKYAKTYSPEYATKLNRCIVPISEDFQYAVESDPLKLIFQWDGLFGITVIVPIETDMKLAKQKILDLNNIS